MFDLDDSANWLLLGTSNCGACCCLVMLLLLLLLLLLVHLLKHVSLTRTTTFFLLTIYLILKPIVGQLLDGLKSLSIVFTSDYYSFIIWSLTSRYDSQLIEDKGFWVLTQSLFLNVICCSQSCSLERRAMLPDRFVPILGDHLWSHVSPISKFIRYIYCAKQVFKRPL